jgi:hypothetical protein
LGNDDRWWGALIWGIAKLCVTSGELEKEGKWAVCGVDELRWGVKLLNSMRRGTPLEKERILPFEDPKPGTGA